MPKDSGARITLEQLAALRDKTDTVAAGLQRRLERHLDVLRPVFAPKRLLGRYVQGNVKEDVAGADKVWAQLGEHFQAVCARPFELPPELEERAMDALDSRLALYPWEYGYEAKAAKETKPVTITAPLRWMLTYASEYTLAELRAVLAGTTERRPDDIREFLVHALAMHLLLAKFPELLALLADLRYSVEVTRHSDLGDLPVVAVNACIRSVRPPDDLIVAATRLSGVPAFVELIDLDAAAGLTDPLRAEIGL